MAYWQEYSLGVAPQLGASPFGVVNSSDADFRWLECDKPKVQFATEIVELELLTGQVGAAPERLVGRRHGTISFSMPLEGFPEGYDPTTDAPGVAAVVPHWFALLGNALGSHIGSDTAANFWLGKHLYNIAYNAAAVASAADTSHITLDAPAIGTADLIAGGAFVVSALTASTQLAQYGYVQDKTGVVLTLLDPSVRKVDDNGANIYGSSTAWLSSLQSTQRPLTMRWVGENTVAAYILQDCVCSGFKLTWESGAVPTIEFSYNFYEYTIDKTEGGLHVPIDHTRIPQIVGVNSGRAMVDGVDTDGLQSCTLEYKTELTELLSHSATQGISGVVYRKPRITASVTVPWESTDLVYDATGAAGNVGSHKWQYKLEAGSTIQLGVYVGPALGRIFAFAVPAARIVAVPQVTEVNGALGYQLSLEAGAYTGDTTDNPAETDTVCPINSLFRASVA